MRIIISVSAYEFEELQLMNGTTVSAYEFEELQLKQRRACHKQIEKMS